MAPCRSSPDDAGYEGGSSGYKSWHIAYLRSSEGGARDGSSAADYENTPSAWAKNNAIGAPLFGQRCNLILEQFERIDGIVRFDSDDVFHFGRIPDGPRAAAFLIKSFATHDVALAVALIT